MDSIRHTKYHDDFDFPNIDLNSKNFKKSKILDGDGDVSDASIIKKIPLMESNGRHRILKNRHQSKEKIIDNNNNIPVINNTKVEETDTHKLESELTNKELEIDKKLIQINNLTNDVTRFKHDSEVLKIDKLNLKEKIIALEKELISVRKENIDLSTNLNSQSSQLKKFEEMNKDLINEYTHKLSQSNEENEKLKKFVENYEVESNKKTETISTLSDEIETLKIQNSKLVIESNTKESLLNEKLNTLQIERDNLRLENNKINNKFDELSNSFNNLQINTIGINSEDNNITIDNFGEKYITLELNKIDNLKLFEIQNILKNILITLNINFSSLKSNITFIRDYISVFFNKIHSILHAKNNGNAIIIDKSLKLNIFDQKSMIKCMDSLLKDIKSLKGL